jgi:hypothetical protein
MADSLPLKLIASLTWRHGIQHNDTQHNNIQHNDTKDNDK